MYWKQSFKKDKAERWMQRRESPALGPGHTHTDDCPVDQTTSGREGTFSTNISGTQHP